MVRGGKGKVAQFILVISYGKHLHKCHLPKDQQQMVIGNKWTDEVTFRELEQSVLVDWDGTKCQIEDNSLRIGEKLSLDIDHSPMNFYLLDLDSEHWHAYDISNQFNITFGAHNYDDVSVKETEIDFVLLRDHLKASFDLELHRGPVYHNYAQVTDNIAVEAGDELFFDGVMIIVGQEDLQMVAPKERFVSKLVPLLESDYPYDDEYPDYHRSPRIIYREPEEKQTIAKPPNKPSKPSEQLARTIVPPLVMIAALGIVSIFRPRGIYIIVMLSVTVVTVIFSITSYVKNVKQYKKDTKHRIKSYKAYLQRKTKELYEISEEQRHALYYHYPDIKQIRQMAMEVDARTYEKTMYHHDFLMYRVGIGKIDSSFETEFNEEEFTQHEDELVDAARTLHEQYREISNVPIATSLINGPVGYIGQRNLVLEQLQLLVMQTALFHSYHDLQFIVIFPEEEKSWWDWMRWLPHARLKDVNVRGFVYHERSRDQVLHTLYQILSERKLAVEEKSNKNEKIYFSPHYTILITDEEIILDHTIMEFFDEDPSELGVSLVFVQDVMQSLPEHVTTVIDILDANRGNIILEEGELVNQAFTPDHFPNGFNKEDVSRALAPLNHLQTLKSSIPETVTFLEMYGVEKVEELGVAHRWAQNETYKSMAVPLGLRGKDDLVYLNLHEKAHGPHGLVAGTTGSGKSEIIQSYIISLAVNFHPYEVAFLLIDYKGGGMANLFNQLPHLLGTITNLDGAQSMRALASIKAELEKRQRLFGEHDVNHINQYQKLFKEGEASEPMPHLFLISDEFAELKEEQPDFMKELVSTARIGRSLGIHLILATQKPSGVVDDQIWSNSKFKLALKVQDARDSNEILKTPDAAEITLPGRAYLQVGNNEIYELFQSAWSGADYVPDQDDQEFIDTTVYAINELGQYDILTEDLSGLDQQKEVEKTVTELDAVIDYIADYTEQQKIEPLPRPWLPPLQERIYLPDLHEVDYTMAWEREKAPLMPTIGFADFPELQDQHPLSVDLAKDGHILVLSSPGYGKSTFLQTVVMDLARTHHPGRLHTYLLDFGTNGLLPLKDLPHVADTLMIDETEKIGKLMRRLQENMKTRKRKLSKHGVANIAMYEQASGESVPNILIVIDNYDSVRETDFVDDFNALITQIAREGGGVGIHLIISAGRQNALRMPLQSNIKVQIPLYLIDYTEVRSIIGRTELEIEEIPGRGLVKLEEATLFQTALPTKGEDALQVIAALQQEAKEMDAYWEGDRPRPIPMMPEGVIDFEEFKKHSETEKVIHNGLLPLGLEFEEVSPFAYDMEKFGPLIVTSDRMDGLEKLQNSIAKSITLLSNSYQTMIVDGTDQSLTKIGHDVNAYISQADGFAAVKNDLISEIKGRLENDHHDQNWIILLADLKNFCEQSQINEKEMALLIDGVKVGIHFILCGDYSYIGRSYEQVPRFVRSQARAGLISMRLGDQDLFKQRYISNEKYPQPYECYYAADHQYVKMKILK